MKLKQLAYLTFLGLFLSSSFTHALSVKSLTLQQLVTLSTRIANVTIEDTRVEQDENGLMVEYITANVNEWILGSGTTSLVYKQIASARDSSGVKSPFKGVAGLPLPVKGKTYLLFLGDDSEKTGLVAPIGLHQGQMELQVDGDKVTVPGLAKKSTLLKSLQTKSLTKSLNTAESNLVNGSESYDDLKASIQSILKK